MMNGSSKEIDVFELKRTVCSLNLLLIVLH